MEYEKEFCPRCNVALESWQDWREHDFCPFVPCDSEDCRALKNPHILQELVTALDHWKNHDYLGGCSHGQ